MTQATDTNEGGWRIRIKSAGQNTTKKKEKEYSTLWSCPIQMTPELSGKRPRSRLKKTPQSKPKRMPKPSTGQRSRKKSAEKRRRRRRQLKQKGSVKQKKFKTRKTP